jgi:phosphoribosyl 1,2-cyclic phosphate phosphodiesterase
MVEVADKTLVIDTGPDFRQQMLREKVKRVDAVLMTHAHKDHIAGLDDIRAFNFRHKKDMPVYGDYHTLKQIQSEFYYAFEAVKYPGVPEIRLHEIDDRPFEVENLHIQPVRVLHHKLPVLGFRIGNFAYITDAKTIPPESIALLKDLDILVLNALRIQPHVSHFNLEEALAMTRLLRPAQTYFTHISHLLGKHERISELLPDGVHLGYDGQILTLA